MKTILVAGLLVFGMAACGSDSFDNVKACKDWKAAMSKCGTTDFTSSINCDSYSSVTTCDIADYFTCLKNGFHCNNNVPDVSGWASCASKAQCK